MISISSIDSTYHDLSHYEKIARILAHELPGLALMSEPLDVIDSLENLSEEMSHMPEVIQDCRLATEAFDQLDDTIGRMYALADRAVELGDDRERERSILDEEFRGYSHIVARLAGADDFDGPSLSLATKPEALAARKILAYLNDARRGFTRKLADQRRQINSAMDEALALLVRIVSDTEDLSHYNREKLQELLDRLAISANDFQLETPRTQSLLH
ncbi:hypothetical protein C4J81_04370 [Deltaproteobacteria bacterium Smac51]|nr:hypothetical protein C4J81_04370 [Deltaproteobacteria bacterium Smac51]